MKRRLSVLVAIGFAMLLGLGVLTSLAMIAGLREIIVRAEASQVSALEVRASVRSLRADYLAMSDAVSGAILGGDIEDARKAKARADAAAADHLAAARAATRRADVQAALAELAAHDRAEPDRLENALLDLAAPDPGRAKDVYFRQYLPARAVNLTLVDRALALATDEVRQASGLANEKARQTIALAWLAFGLFVVLGTTGGLRLSGAVRNIARGFEEAAAKVGEQRDHLRAVMTAMRDALMVVDGYGMVVMVNEAACALLAYAETELVGTALARYVGADGAPGGTPLGRTEMRNEPVTFVTRAGARIPMSVSAAPLPRPDGGPAGAVWVARDMREQLRMLAEVEAARDAALEGSRIKSEFLANMSHEIRTPMNVILGYTDIALETELSGPQREYLDGVRRSAVALLEIINDILDLSKVEAGKLTLESVPFELPAALAEVMHTLEGHAREKALGLRAAVPDDVPPLLGDPTRLRQVLVNLVGNAIKFTDAGEVVVRVEVDSVAPDGTLVLHFAVSDTGIGISADKREVIFHAFTQADGSMTRRYGGTGLGLTIAAQLVAMMGGRIWVESELGTGSVFHFTARLMPRPSGDSAAAAPPRAASAGDA